MNITSIIAKITRKLHAQAVALHLKGLRATIKGSDLRLTRAVQSSGVANAIAIAAIEHAQAKASAVTAVKAERLMLKLAAQTEAQQIGGSL